VNVVALPLTGFAPDNALVASHLYEQAAWVADGAYGDVRTVVLLIETADGELRRRTIGQPIDRARVCGLLSIAASRAATDAPEEEL
jgi:hypothetical protein